MKNKKDKKVIIQFDEKRTELGKGPERRYPTNAETAERTSANSVKKEKTMGQHARDINRLSDAMKTLDELAGQEKEEIKELLSSQFGNLRKTLLEIEPEVRKTLEHTSERFSHFASEAKEATKEKAKQIGHEVDDKVHEMPWTFMGVSAAAGILAGYYLGHHFSGRSPSNRRA